MIQNLVDLPDPAVMFEAVRERESRARTYASTIGRVLDKGRLARVYDSDGNGYLDCLSCAGTLALGHNHPYVRERVVEFLQSDHILQGLDITTPAKWRFIDRLFKCLPASFAGDFRIQFCGPTGADAVEAALKLFKTATGRRTILAFHGGYHGMTAGALALTGNLTAKLQVASLMPDVHFLPYPHAYRCPFGTDGSDTATLSLAYIEHLLTDPESGILPPAAIILEAVQGEGGVIPAPVAWLRGLRELTTRLGIPLIVDEVQTGFGRTGDMFAFEASGIEPDAILISKAVGGGFPMAALLYHKRYDTWQPGAHAGTFRGNQIAMVAGAAFMEFIQQEDLLEKVRQRGRQLQTGLLALAAEFPEIGDVRGRGLMWGMEIVNRSLPTDRQGRHPVDGDNARRLKQVCLEHGLLIETGGRAGGVLRLLPPLIVTSEDIAELLHKLGSAFRAGRTRLTMPSMMPGAMAAVSEAAISTRAIAA